MTLSWELALGAPSYGLRKGTRLPARFWEKVAMTEGCWLWTAAKAGRGYGAFTTRKPIRKYAHRLVYEDQVGPIPDGYDIDHLCRNIACVRPDHLEAVTHRENLRRGIFSRSLRTACEAGHPYTPETTGRYGPNKRGRACLICRKEYARRRIERRAA